MIFFYLLAYIVFGSAGSSLCAVFSLFVASGGSSVVAVCELLAPVASLDAAHGRLDVWALVVAAPGL